MACQKFAFECGEEALAFGIVVGVTDRSNGRADASLPKTAAERQCGILPWSPWWMTSIGLRWPIAISSAASTSSVRGNARIRRGMRDCHRVSEML
jgi:hypothetical protein